MALRHLNDETNQIELPETQTNNGGNNMFGTFASIVGSLIGAAVSYENAKKNRESQEKQNQQNLDYAKATTENQWERDDTTYQRSVADATAAGFSPLAVLDGGLSPNSSALAYQGQAPQLDINSVVQSLMNASNQIYQSSESEKSRSHELKIQEKEFENNIDLLNQQLKNSKTEKSIELQNTLKVLEETTNANIYSKEYESYIEELREYGIVETQEYTDLEEYKTAKRLWLTNFNTFIHSDEVKQTTTTKGAKGEVHADIHAGATTGVPGILSGELSGNLGGSVEGSSQTQEENAKLIENATLRFMIENPFPVFKRQSFKVAK